MLGPVRLDRTSGEHRSPSYTAISLCSEHGLWGEPRAFYTDRCSILCNMEWTNDLVLALIHEYRDHSDLWDSNSASLKNKTKRDRAWAEIADKLGTDTNEVKKKMNSALASFRRERSKVLKAGNEFKDAYESKWFAFDSFRFLMDKTAPKLHDDILGPMIESTYNIEEFDCAAVIKNEMDDQPEELGVHYSTSFDHTSASQEQPPIQQPAQDESGFNYKRRGSFSKRKYQYDPRVSSLCKIARRLSCDYEKRDECKVFGEYLVFKLRNYDSRTRSVVQHLITNIVFNADMGKYSKSDNEKSENSVNKNSDNASVVAHDKIVSHDIDYLQEISNIVSDGKHFLDV